MPCIVTTTYDDCPNLVAIIDSLLYASFKSIGFINDYNWHRDKYNLLIGELSDVCGYGYWGRYKKITKSITNICNPNILIKCMKM